ncbi:MAG: Gmad2 immunoglobulin-like domain-containing protein [Salibacteraceae bacterium]
MKYYYIFTILLFLSCNSNEKKAEAPDPGTTGQEEVKAGGSKELGDAFLSDGKSYSNTRFRDVTVERKDKNTFLVEGKAQLFEATYSWVIEDGHRELKEGFGTAEAGAPEWGTFRFRVEAEKKEPNTVLHLILFESSAKDGSRQHELMIPLY